MITHDAYRAVTFRSGKAGMMKTVLNSTRLLNLALRMREMVEGNVPGDVVECGVGGSALTLAREILDSDRTLWLYDTFSGLPYPGKHDGATAVFHAGQNVVSTDEVIKSLTYGLRFPAERLQIVAGHFSDSFDRDPRPREIALLHVDADWYDSVWLCLDAWYDKISVGGVVILDDFGYWSGCRQAFYEFIVKNKVTPAPLLNRSNEAAWWIKGEGR